MSINNIHVSTKKEFITLAKAKGISPATLMASTLERLMKLKLGNISSLSNLKVLRRDNHIMIYGSNSYFVGLKCRITIRMNKIRVQAMPASELIIRKICKTHKCNRKFSKEMLKTLSSDLCSLCKLHNVKMTLENKERSQVKAGNNKLYPNIYLMAFHKNESSTRDTEYIFQILFVLMQLTDKMMNHSSKYFVY